MKKIFTFFSAVFLIGIGAVMAQTLTEKQKIVNETNIVALQEMSKEYSKSYEENKILAIKTAKEKGWKINSDQNGVLMQLQRISEAGRPLYYITQNADAAISVSTNKVYSGGGLGLALDGTGMIAGEWDGGDVLTTHQEFNNTGSPRVIDMDGISSTHYHATHVAGTIMAGGVQANAKGMAYNSSLHAYDWSNDESEMATAASNGLLISNHSYGFAAGWSWDGSSWTWEGNTSISNEEDYQFGFYSSYCAEIDNIALNAPYYLIVKSAGNDLGDWDGSSTLHPQDGGADGYDCISYKGNAKNILTVGAVNDVAGGYSQPSDVTLASFSSTGPCDDSRIKPDIVGNGVNLYSTFDGNNTDYSSISGTSMSSPNVTGSLLLLQEHYNETQGSFMKASTIKALAIHTADECGDNIGPDYKFGWGLLNTATAATVISERDISSLIKEETYSGSVYTLDVFATGTEPLTVTIVWTDPAGTPPAASLDPTDIMLVNDLDMTITGTGGPYYPYNLIASNPSAAATTGDNDVDNVEKIYISNPTAGAYTITINHEGSISGGTQDFSIVVTGIIADPDKPTLTANASGTSQIDLSWIKNGTGDDVMLAWSSDGNFGTPVNGISYSASDVLSGGGQVLYIGSGTTYNHIGLNEAQKYYYKAWSVLTGQIYSTGSAADATTNSSGGMTLIFEDDFDTDKGWTLTGEWERGQPQGLGGEHGNPDPTSAFIGTKVLGLDLSGQGSNSGDYEANATDMTSSPIINCSDYSDVHVYFRLWLNVESNTYDHAYFNVSGNNGSSWNQIFENTEEYTMTEWMKTSGEYGWDISDHADGNSQVLLQYSVDVDDSWFYSGWNIDSVRVTGIYNPCSAPTIIAQPQSHTVCESEGVTFTIVADGSGLNYQWKKGGTNISGAISSSYNILNVVPSDAGDYTCEITGNCGSLTSNTATLNVNPLPEQPSSIVGENTPCEGTTETYSITNVSGVTYAWNLPADWTGTSSTNSITVTVGSLSGNISVTPSNSCGNGPSRNLGISVIAEPTQSSSISGSSAPCEGASETYSVINVSGMTYDWNLPSGWTGTSTTNSIVVTVGNSGGTITVTPSNSCGTGIARTFDVSVGNQTAISTQPVDVNAVVGEDISFNVVATGDNLAYQWRKNGVDIGSNSNIYAIDDVQFVHAGNYDVIVNGNCGDETSDVAVLSVGPNSIKNLSEFGIEIYPNPSDGNFNIRFNESIDDVKIIISDMTGKAIYNEVFDSYGNHEIRLNPVSKGVYFIQFKFNDKHIISKLVIE